MRILITGGAGYIGSHAARHLNQHGHQIWVYDNLSTGHRESVEPQQLVIGDVQDEDRLTSTLREKEIDAVIHFAACALVGESMVDPAKYYHNNVVATYHLLASMREAEVTRIVFSSTTATYGEPKRQPIREDEPQQPVNPYGFTKRVVEQMLRDYAKAYEIRYAALRYFNAAGAAEDATIGEDHDPESHLIPIVLQTALGQRKQLTVFGDDYPTRDGTCIRDYVHVEDLASAHRLALERMDSLGNLELNLGSGRGSSVREVVEACQRVTGTELPIQVGARRPGDPPELVADAKKAHELLGWQPRFESLEEIVATAWEWHRKHPSGFLSDG